ncbi:hypothetical protein [Piscirickettsia salmonis]|nr:hypothetical protein [Piscirickettsia salmonis]QHS26309.1 hypothetical protein GW538_10760 [Piscirickettsia salmonis]
MEKFIQLKEEIVQEIPSTDRKLYGSCPVYYSIENRKSFKKSKEQLVLLLGRIIAKNPSALEPLKKLRSNIARLKIDNKESEKTPLLVDLKKRFESLFLYNQSLLKKLSVGQFNDLTLDACYPGAYSNAVMLIDRITSGRGLNNYLLSEKREFIQQQALNFLLETDATIRQGSQIHAINSLYNYVASSYNMQSIVDPYVSNFRLGYLNSFVAYLRERVTPANLLNLVHEMIPKI